MSGCSSPNSLPTQQDVASRYALYAEVLRNIFITAQTYASHNNNNNSNNNNENENEEVMCYDIVRAAQRELIDPSASLSTLKPLLQDCRQTQSVSVTIIRRLSEHMAGATILVDNQLAQQIVEEVMLQCLISGTNLSDAVAHVESEYVERESARQKRVETITADPAAKQLYNTLLTEIRAGNGAAVFGENFQNIVHNDTGERNDSVGSDDILSRNGCDDQEYCNARIQKCGCETCQAVAHTITVWKTWSPQDNIEQEIHALVTLMCNALFESAEGVVDDLLDENDNSDDDDENDSNCELFSFSTQ